MTILSRSVLGSFLAVVLLSFLVLSFVLTLGLLMPLAGYFVKGVGLQYLLKLLVIGFHETLQLTVPISLFFSAHFVFSRLKTDGELDAMSACGIRLWRVAAGPVVFAALVSGLFLWVNCEILPLEHLLRRTLRADVARRTQQFSCSASQTGSRFYGSSHLKRGVKSLFFRVRAKTPLTRRSEYSILAAFFR